MITESKQELLDTIERLIWSTHRMDESWKETEERNPETKKAVELLRKYYKRGDLKRITLGLAVYFDPELDRQLRKRS